MVNNAFLYWFQIAIVIKITSDFYDYTTIGVKG